MHQLIKLTFRKYIFPNDRKETDIHQVRKDSKAQNKS